MRTWVTGKSPPLANLGALEQLNVGGTDVTESGLACFRRCPTLKSLTIPDTLDVGRVRAMLPNVTHVDSHYSSLYHAELRQNRKVAADAARKAAATNAPAP